VGRFAILLGAALLFAAAGCGGSRSSDSSSTVSRSGTARLELLTATAAPPTAPETSPPTATTTTSVAPPPTTSSTTSTTNSTAPATTSPPPTDERLPATYTINAGGSLNPPVVTAPPQIPVQLTVVSADGRSHRVLLRTPVAHALAVPAHGRATVLLTGLKLGRYALDVDGVARGALVIGGAPGP
jgi:hypothetical protein